MTPDRPTTSRLDRVTDLLRRAEADITSPAEQALIDAVRTLAAEVRQLRHEADLRGVYR